MPPSLPRQAASLHLSVSSRNASVFAQSAEARHPLHCPRHFLSRYAGRTASLTRLQCSFYTTACRFARPTEMAPFVFTKVWNFYFRAFPHLVALIRVGYNYLSEQTIPRTGLSPAGITALWAARTPETGFNFFFIHCHWIPAHFNLNLYRMNMTPLQHLKLPTEHIHSVRSDACII